MKHRLFTSSKYSLVDNIEPEFSKRRIETNGKEKRHSKKSNSTKKALKRFHYQATSLIYVMIVICFLVAIVAAYYGVVNYYLYSRCDVAQRFADRVHVLCETIPQSFVSLTAILFYESSIGTYQTQDIQELLGPFFDTFTESKDEFIALYRNTDVLDFNHKYASKTLQQRYINMTDQRVCSGLSSSGVFQSCTNIYNGVARLGVASLYEVIYQNTIIIRDKVYAMKNITDSYNISSDLIVLLTAGSYINKVTYNSTVIEGQNLKEFASDVLTNIVYIFMAGIAMIFCLFILVWRPSIKRLGNKFLSSRSVYLIMPLQIMTSNAYIKALFNNQG